MILNAQDVSKTFDKSGGVFRLQIDNFEISEGSFTAMLGPNGSGKSTFIKIILNLIFADTGQVTLNGVDHKNKEARAGVSYLPENFSFPENFTVERILRSFAGLKGSQNSNLDSKITMLAETFNVDYLDKKFKDLSKGMAQMAALMHTFLADDQFYILDEPFNGLDAVKKKAVMDYIFALQEERNISILITTHILSDIDKTCDSLHLIKDGSIINSAAKAEIQEHFGTVEEYYLDHFETKNPVSS